jgi:hypothetical protein
MGTAGTLGNKMKSGFVRFPPDLSIRVGKNILALPDAPFAVCDPTCGEGDFFYATAHSPHARYFGVEISAQRAGVCQQRWPNAMIVNSGVEVVNMKGKVQLLLTNAPFFWQNGKRAPYRLAADAGEWLDPGGIHVSTFTARSDWDLRMINHWLSWYDRVHVWKFPNRQSDNDESTFEDYTQILVVGIRRATPLQPGDADRKRLLGYHWKEPKKEGASGWRYGFGPPDIPLTPLDDPYRVPTAREMPCLVVRNADEATLLKALDSSGAHLSDAWQQATTWPEADVFGPPAMPFAGEAHVAANVMVGGLDGEVVWGPGVGPEAQPHLFTAFIGKEWVPMPVDEELQEKLREEGCIRVEMKQLMDKPILGVLNLQTGRSRYYQGEDVFSFLQPWIPSLASRVIAKREPLYRLDPADWEVRLLSQYATDKRLPNASHAGLAVAQLHRVFAMCRSLDVKGRTAIQGEPGTGKTRLAGGTAKRQAYRWRHRNSEFRQTLQPDWIAGLRRAWLKNPATLEMLGLSPVYGSRVKGKRGGRGQVVVDPTTRHLVAYRERATGKLIAPEDAGPKALPVLITTPLKVTKEYGKEVKAAFPHAEVVHIESYRDIPRWLERCAVSNKPVVFGVFSHSTTRAFGREWREAVREKLVKERRPMLNPPEELLPSLEPVKEMRGKKEKLVGYRYSGSDEILTELVDVSYFFCPDCGGRIDAVPGKLNQPEDEDDGKKKRKPGQAEPGDEGKKESAGDPKFPVTSRTWFTAKPRWCKCESSKRGQERASRGLQPNRAPLWQDDRTKVTNRKHPQMSYAAVSKGIEAIGRAARAACAQASLRDLVERVRRDDALLVKLVDAALLDGQAAQTVLELVGRVDSEATRLAQALRQQKATLGSSLLEWATVDQELIDGWIDQSLDDEERLHRVVDIAIQHEPALADQLSLLLEQVGADQRLLREAVTQTLQTETGVLLRIVGDLMQSAASASPFLEAVLAVEPMWEMTVRKFREEREVSKLALLVTKIAQRHEDLCQQVLAFGFGDPELRVALFEEAERINSAVGDVVEGIQENLQVMVDLVKEVARQREAAARTVIAECFLPETAFATLLVDLAVRDLRSLRQVVSVPASREDEVVRQVRSIQEYQQGLTTHVREAARRDSSHQIMMRLIESTRNQVDWESVFFRLMFDQAHHRMVKEKKKRGESSSEDFTRPGARGVRLAEAEQGPLVVEEIDRRAADGYTPVRDEAGNLYAYQLGHQGKLLVPLYSRWSRRIIGFVDAKTGQVVTKKTAYDFRMPPQDSFSPYEYLYTFFRGCVALAVVDESHNGRGRRTDIAHSHHFAMLSAQTRELTSGTHYGGTILDFYHYWFRYHPRFWLERGYGWNDAERALSDYGAIQEWLKEYVRESDARRGSGTTDIYVSTIPAPGLSANLIPGLLEDLTYLTVLDVGAHMPPKQEIPKALSMKDPILEARRKEADRQVLSAREAVNALRVQQREHARDPESQARQAQLVDLEERLGRAEKHLEEMVEQAQATEAWIERRDLATAYDRVVKELEELAMAGNTAARLAQGTVPRWFAALPCESPFKVYKTERGEWGEKGEPELLIETPVLEWDYLYVRHVGAC